MQVKLRIYSIANNLSVKLKALVEVKENPLDESAHIVSDVHCSIDGVYHAP